MGSRWGCGCGLLPVDSLLRRELSCPALLFSQHLRGTRKTEPARTKAVCSPLAWAFKPAKKITQNQSEKQEGPDFSGTIEGRWDGPYTSFWGPQRSQGPGLFIHWGPADHSHGVLTEGTHDPRWGSGDCVSLTCLHGSGHVYGGTTHIQRYENGMNTWERHLCLGINALQCSLYISLCLSASLPPQSSPSLGLLETPQVSLPGKYSIFQHEHGGKGGRFTWWVDCRAHGSGKKPMGSRWCCCCDLLPVDHPYSAETRPALCLSALCLACFLHTSVEQERIKPARTKVVCSTFIMTAIKQLVSHRTKGEKGGLPCDKSGERRTALHFFLPSQKEPTRFHLRGPTSRDLMS